jgi:signal transduction histidine kinase
VIERTKRLAKTNKELNNINKELDTFIYKASHDLLGPLARLKGIVNVASMEVEDKTSRKYFNMLNDSAQRTYEILRTLIQLISIRESGIEPQETNLEEMMKEIVKELETMDGFDEVNIECSYQGVRKAILDRKLLKIILSNLMNNAIEYRDISKHTQSYVTVDFSNGGEQLKIVVVDNGIGIDKESSEKIFDMFYRGSLISKGSGLGLYISRVIVRKFGGNIEYSINEDGDTMFSVSIPLKEPTSLPVS